MKKLLEKVKSFKKTSNNDILVEKEAKNAALKGASAKMAYSLVDNPIVTKELFRRIQQALSEMNQKTKVSPTTPPRLMQEWGRLDGGRQFFFLKPWGQDGFLFEEAGKGWIISKAHKISEQQRFMRSSEAWDVVNVFVNDWEESLPRLSSSRFGSELMSYPLYEEALMESISSSTGIA